MKVAIYNFREFNPYIGGIERISVSLAKGLLERGIEVIFIAVYKSQYKIEYKIPAIQYFLPNTDTCSKENIERMRQILQEEKVDILLDQDSHSLVSHNLAYAAVCKTRVKLVTALHFCPSTRLLLYKHPFDRNMFSVKENIVNGMKNLAYRWPFWHYFLRDQRYHYRKMYEESDKVVLLSDKFIAEYCKISELKEYGKLCAINNMLSFAYEEQGLNKENRILFCARMAPQKKPERALYVWKKIYKKMPDWSLEFVGDGFQLDDLRRLATKMNLERVTFHGFLPPQDFYKKSKIYLMTSDYEGWGLTLTEAMQYKCVPLVMSTYSSVYDIIDDGKNGFLIPNVDCQEMAKKTYYLATHHAELDDMAQAAFEKAGMFKAEVIMDKWVKLFKTIL